MAKTKFNISDSGLLTFPMSTFGQFHHTNKQHRYGQAIHDFFKLEKTVQDKDFALRLYFEPSDEKAKAMVTSRLDYNN